MVRDRRSWWNSKCLWCISAVLLNYVIFALTAILSALFYCADFKIICTTDFMTKIFGENMAYMTSSVAIWISFFLPCIVTMGVCLLQILIGFLTTPVVSFACICGLYVLSAYYTSWFLIGNFTMWLRSTYLTEEGVHPFSGLILGMILSICVWYIGKKYFENKDIL